MEGCQVKPLTFDRKLEFPHLKDNVYLDHAGCTLYSNSQVLSFSELLSKNLFTNPHSRHALSQRTAEEITQVRRRVLSFFRTDSSAYSVIFTSGATASMKLLAESFDFDTSGVFAHLREVHTSVLGMREIAKLRNAKIICMQESDITSGNIPQSKSYSRKLIAIPGQCNFSGKKYDMSYVDALQKEGWKVMLDAASLAATSQLDLSTCQADFVVLSFYKMFGFPTGIGALLVRKSAETDMKKCYFGGGTVEIAIGEEQFHVFRSNFVQRFEDGTISFLNILALNFGFDVLDKLGGGMEKISNHTLSLAKYAHGLLSDLRHSNGTPAVIVYSDDCYKDPGSQGSIVALNLLNPDGSHIGFASVEKVMESFGIQVRTGCFCNTGACQKYLGLTSENLRSNFKAGHVCGDSLDIIDGRPTGAIRISFGYMSSQDDVDAFISAIRDVFVERSVLLDPIKNGIADFVLSEMYLYPVKSCRGVKVDEWPIGTDGFKFDRRFFISNSNGTTVTLKHNMRLYDIVCRVDLSIPKLTLSVSSQSDFIINLSEPCACGYLKSILQMFQQTDLSEASLSSGLVESRVCGQRVNAFDCGLAAQSWLSSYLKDDMYRLFKYKDRPASSNSHSAANSAPFLLVCSASIKYLISLIPEPFSVEELVERMRPNLVIETSVPFEEDSWTKIKIGDVDFEVVEKCSRCQMVSVDPRNGKRTREPLQTIAKLRGDKMHFGILIRQANPNDSEYSIDHVLREGNKVVLRDF